MVNLEGIVERTLGQKLLAEAVGTLTLIFIGCGSILLAATNPGLGGGIVQFALAHGLAIGVMVSAMGHISGGHFNPAVTIGAWVTARLDAKTSLLYILAQLSGASLGALLLRAALPGTVWNRPGVDLATPAVTGQFISNGQAVLIEAILTFFLVWVVFAMAVDPDGAFHKIAGLGIGFTVTMDILMGGGFTGAAMNPARHFGPALLSGTWDNWWVWYIGPIAGGIVAASLYDWMILSKRAPAVSEEAEPPHGVGVHGDHVAEDIDPV